MSPPIPWGFCSRPVTDYDSSNSTTSAAATVLFYNPEDPPLMPLEASQALHRSQLLPSAVLALGSLAWLASGTAGPHPLLLLPLELLFGLALSVSVAVPMWIGIRYDHEAPSRVMGALRAFGIWCWFQGLILALAVVICGLLLDQCGVWIDRTIDNPTSPLGGVNNPLI
ncbi:MAG: hypothetical protein ACK6D3_15105 [Planctomycetaceae bacterium]